VHELGIAQRIVDVLDAEARGARVTRVRVRIGKLVAVLPDALRFAWTLATEGTVAEGAALEVEETPGRARCRACGATLELDRPFGECACGGVDLEWLGGRELTVVEMELAGAPAPERRGEE
jgi:hydrogenase nickel incorporation protein HypA/HybF